MNHGGANLSACAGCAGTSRRSGYARAAVAVVLGVLAFASAASAEVFDWRNVDGQDWMSPVRDQGLAGTCWAFSAVAALEAHINITAGDAEWDVDLSEQHLVSDGSAGRVTGGWEMKALNFFVSTGVVTEQELPYAGEDPSLDWPLAPGWEDRVFKATLLRRWVPPDNTTIKYYLQTYGPLTTGIDTAIDWYWPDDPPVFAGLGGGGDGSVGRGATDNPVGYGSDEPLAGIDHAAVITGFVDDDAMGEGGYWIIKNSWGAGWGDDGYGYMKYGVVETNSRIHSLKGEAIWPDFEPGDIDRNGVIDSSDIDWLFDHLTGPGVSADALYDLDGDGDADHDDVDVLVHDIIGTEYGDFDLSYAVTTTDLAVLSSHYGESDTSWAMGDVNGDNVIDTTDLAILATNFGFVGSDPNVPEPASLSLLGLAGLAILKRRK